MPVCAVKLCRNYAGKPYNNTKITFHRFPTDTMLSNRWRDIIRQTRNDEEWEPHKNSVVCSAHFSDDALYFTKSGFRRLINGSVPSKCLFLSGTKPESSPNIKQEPSDSNMAIDNRKQIIEPKPSCSKEPVKEEPTTGVQDFSNVESTFESSNEVLLRRTLCRKIKLERKHRAVINALRKRNIRLKKQNILLKGFINTLKNKKPLNNGVLNVIEGNLFATNLYSQMSKIMKGKYKRPAKYSLEFRRFCWTLHSLSPLAYSFVRKKLERCLPHPKTLTKWKRNSNGSPGLTKNALQTENSEETSSSTNCR